MGGGVACRRQIPRPPYQSPGQHLTFNLHLKLYSWQLFSSMPQILLSNVIVE